MPSQHFSHEEWFSRFNDHLARERYATATACSRTIVAKSFLSFLKNQNIDLLAAQSAHVDRYLQHGLSAYGQRYGRRVPGRYWQSAQLKAIHLLLRFAHRRWPAPRPALTSAEAFCREMCERYAQWMTDVRGFAQITVLKRCNEARSFLGWLESGSVRGVALLTVADVDEYMKERAVTLRRTGLKCVANALRSFLRWLHSCGQTQRDLSAVLIGPSLYAFEGIPSALKWRDVETVLAATRQDCTPKGIRDHAIWMLLSRYGLRSRELRMLRLDDINWSKETIRIHHSKTGTTSYLPLLPEVGEAVLCYLEKVRTQLLHRKILIRHIAPPRP